MKSQPSLPERLPLRRIGIGNRWMRIHLRGRSPLWFGPGSGNPAIHRFDDPLGRFGVCYFGTNSDVCFAETFLRNPPVRILALDDLADRSVSTFEVGRELRLVAIYGSGLARYGNTKINRTAFYTDRVTMILRYVWRYTTVLRMLLPRLRVIA